MEKQGKIVSLKNKRAINPNNEPLTVEKLKTFKGTENLSEEEASQMLNEIKLLSAIMVDYLKNNYTDDQMDKFNLNQAA